MRIVQLPICVGGLAVLSLIPTTTAVFIPSLLRSLESLQNVEKRCANPCGYYGQLCCASDEVCYTDANDQAQCGVASQGSAQAQATTSATAQNGYYTFWTTTFLQTDYSTVTSTMSSFVAQTTGCDSCNSGCQYSLGETPCGSTCCKSGYWCQQEDMCVAVNGVSTALGSSLYTVTTVVTNTASAAARPTSNVIITVTSTGSAGEVYTTTQAYGAPATTGTGGLLDGLLALFGMGPNRRRRTEEVDVYEEKKKKESSGITKFAGVGALLGGLALLLGLKRRRDERRESKSEVSYGSSYYTYDTSTESQSDRIPRRSDRSRSRQHYSRITVNQNHSHANASASNSTNRQPSAGDLSQNTMTSLSSMNEAGSPGADGQLSEENRRVLQWVADLMEPARRESALMELSKKREQVPELALVLWYSFGVMTSLLQEIISVYPLLNPSQLTAAASNRVCNALALLQCVASHNETRGLFLNAHIPLFLYPFLNTTSKSRPFDPTITFLLTTEIIPLCLRIMETGSELSKTVAIFIVQKILLDDTGLGYICATYERFYAVGTVLSNMVAGLVETQTVRLLKHVVRCFLRLSDNNRARQALRQCLPEPLRDATFSNVLRDDAATKRCLAQLLINLSDTVADAQADQFE
ncbi:hypothetical protein DV736_g1420, partial [Chaetothyriales sp. CBS 134916]